jgi:hypothetical protein
MRFEDVTSDVERLVAKLIDEQFPALEGAVIKVLFDTKKRKAGGRYVIGRIKKANDEMKALAANEDGVPPDYVLFLDKNVWQVIDDRDKERVIFHELNHCEVKFDSENQYRIKDHEIQGFYSETDFNADDIRWSERLGAVAEHVYDPPDEDNTMDYMS